MPSTIQNPHNHHMNLMPKSKAMKVFSPALRSRSPQGDEASGRVGGTRGCQTQSQQYNTAKNMAKQVNHMTVYNHNAQLNMGPNQFGSGPNQINVTLRHQSPTNPTRHIPSCISSARTFIPIHTPNSSSHFSPKITTRKGMLIDFQPRFKTASGVVGFENKEDKTAFQVQVRRTSPQRTTTAQGETSGKREPVNSTATDSTTILSQTMNINNIYANIKKLNSSSTSDFHSSTKLFNTKNSNSAYRTYTGLLSNNNGPISPTLQTQTNNNLNSKTQRFSHSSLPRASEAGFTNQIPRFSPRSPSYGNPLPPMRFNSPARLSIPSPKIFKKIEVLQVNRSVILDQSQTDYTDKGGVCGKSDLIATVGGPNVTNQNLDGTTTDVLSQSINTQQTAQNQSQNQTCNPTNLNQSNFLNQSNLLDQSHISMADSSCLNQTHNTSSFEAAANGNLNTSGQELYNNVRRRSRFRKSVKPPLPKANQNSTNTYTSNVHNQSYSKLKLQQHPGPGHLPRSQQTQSNKLYSKSQSRNRSLLSHFSPEKLKNKVQKKVSQKVVDIIIGAHNVDNFNSVHNSPEKKIATNRAGSSSNNNYINHHKLNQVTVKSGNQQIIQRRKSLTDNDHHMVKILERVLPQRGTIELGRKRNANVNVNGQQYGKNTNSNSILKNFNNNLNISDIIDSSSMQEDSFLRGLPGPYNSQNVTEMSILQKKLNESNAAINDNDNVTKFVTNSNVNVDLNATTDDTDSLSKTIDCVNTSETKRADTMSPLNKAQTNQMQNSALTDHIHNDIMNSVGPSGSADSNFDAYSMSKQYQVMSSGSAIKPITFGSSVTINNNNLGSNNSESESQSQFGPSSSEPTQYNPAMQNSDGVTNYTLSSSDKIENNQGDQGPGTVYDSSKVITNDQQKVQCGESTRRDTSDALFYDNNGPNGHVTVESSSSSVGEVPEEHDQNDSPNINNLDPNLNSNNVIMTDKLKAITQVPLSLNHNVPDPNSSSGSLASMYPSRSRKVGTSKVDGYYNSSMISPTESTTVTGQELGVNHENNDIHHNKSNSNTHSNTTNSNNSNSYNELLESESVSYSNSNSCYVSDCHSAVNLCSMTNFSALPSAAQSCVLGTGPGISPTNYNGTSTNSTTEFKPAGPTTTNTTITGAPGPTVTTYQSQSQSQSQTTRKFGQFSVTATKALSRIQSTHQLNLGLGQRTYVPSSNYNTAHCHPNLNAAKYQQQSYQLQNHHQVQQGQTQNQNLQNYIYQKQAGTVTTVGHFTQPLTQSQSQASLLTRSPSNQSRFVPPNQILYANGNNNVALGSIQE